MKLHSQEDTSSCSGSKAGAAAGGRLTAGMLGWEAAGAAGLAGLQQGRVHCVRLALEALHDLIVVSPCGVELGRIHRLLQCDVTFTLCCPNSSTTAMDDMSSCQAYALC